MEFLLTAAIPVANVVEEVFLEYNGTFKHRSLTLYNHKIVEIAKNLEILADVSYNENLGQMGVILAISI